MIKLWSKFLEPTTLEDGFKMPGIFALWIDGVHCQFNFRVNLDDTDALLQTEAALAEAIENCRKAIEYSKVNHED